VIRVIQAGGVIGSFEMEWEHSREQPKATAPRPSRLCAPVEAL